MTGAGLSAAKPVIGSFRIEETAWKELKAWADAEHRPLVNLVTHILLQALEQRRRTAAADR